MSDYIFGPLRPMVEALFARLLAFFLEKMAELTRLYEAQLTRMNEAAERQGQQFIKGMGRALLALAAAYPIGAAIALALLCLYLRYKWRRWRMEEWQLAEAKRQNVLTSELGALLKEQNQLRRIELGLDTPKFPPGS